MFNIKTISNNKKYILLSLCLLSSNFIFASIGMVAAVSGDVKIFRDKTTLKAINGLKLEEKDKIETF